MCHLHGFVLWFMTTIYMFGIFANNRKQLQDERIIISTNVNFVVRMRKLIIYKMKDLWHYIWLPSCQRSYSIKVFKLYMNNRRGLFVMATRNHRNLTWLVLSEHHLDKSPWHKAHVVHDTFHFTLMFTIPFNHNFKWKVS